MSQPMIVLKKLAKTYQAEGQAPVVAVDGIDLTINRGEIFGVIGLSGAGKSTLIRCLNLLETPTAGTIAIDGTNMTTLNPGQLRRERQKIGMIFQHFNLLSSRTVSGNVAFPLEIAGVSPKAIAPKVKELLHLVGLGDKADAYPSQLSGGQKQRVGIARALANDPKVLLCDEATSALDPYTTGSILSLLRQINRRLGLTIVLITHEMHVIKAICDRVAVLEHGKVVESGPTLDIFAQPQTTTTRQFINNVLDTEIPDSILNRPRPKAGHIGTLVKISFVGPAAGEPLISAMVKDLDIDANILYGSIDQIKDTPFGVLLLELVGSPPQVEQALNYLESATTHVEVVKGVKESAV